MNLSESLLVEVSRGSMIESFHYVDAVIVTATGEIVAAWGDVEREIYARSSLKPLQALPLIETGAAYQFGLSDTEIALACASHQGQNMHVNAVERILKQIELSESDLECGVHWPLDLKCGEMLARSGGNPTRLHNNCSGKHVGFLATAVHLNEDTTGYIQFDHPIQSRVLEVIAEMANCDVNLTARGFDGCGVPVVGIPLIALAHAMARMADPYALGATRASAVRRIVFAMSTNPVMVGGYGTLDTAGMTAMENVVLKGGAEGVHVAILPEQGMGVALKTLDGNSRAGDAAVLWVLKYLKLLSGSVAEELTDFIEPPVKNTLGNVVGRIVTREMTGSDQ